LFLAQRLSQEDPPVSTDPEKVTVWEQFRQRGLRAFGHVLTAERVRFACGRIGARVGTGPLNLVNLVWLSVACAWHKGKSFAAVLALFVKLVHDAPAEAGLAAPPRRGPKNKHDPRGQDPCSVTEEAFVQARARFPGWLFDTLLRLLADDFERGHPGCVRWKGFRLLALDGTSVAQRRWRGLAGHCGRQGNGRGQGPPSARLVMLTLPLARLPWRYELTPLADDERAVAARLLDRLRRDDLVLFDRGLFSYGLFWQVQAQGAFFATRVKAGVQFQEVRSLGRGDRLVRWQPRDWRKDWRRRGLPASMALRVLDYHIKGFRPSAVLTNVLDPEAVSRDEWVRLASADEAGRTVDPGLYHRRWEIETTFAELKVTQGLEGGLRSRTPAGVHFEVGGHVLLYFLTRWLMAAAAAQAGLDPLRLSFQGARDELGDLWQNLFYASDRRAAEVLLPRLRQRIASHTVPLRPGRSFPRPRDGKPKDKGRKRKHKATKKRCQKTGKKKNAA
jgi:hypothetical protein